MNLMFGIEKAHLILDEMIMDGQIAETNRSRMSVCLSKLLQSELVYFSQDITFGFILCYNLLVNMRQVFQFPLHQIPIVCNVTENDMTEVRYTYKINNKKVKVIFMNIMFTQC